MLRVAGLSHSCPTYSLNSRLLTVPLIPCTRACATVTMHQPSNHPAATVTIPAVLLTVQPPHPNLLRFRFWSVILDFRFYFYPNKAPWKQRYRNTSLHSNLSRSVFPSNTPSHPHPPSAPHPFPVLTSS